MTGTGKTVSARRPTAKRRIGTAARLAILTPALFLAWSGTIAQQDISALIEATRGNAPRWMSTIEAAQHSSSQAPSLVLADASKTRSDDTPDYAITNAAPGSDPAVVRGLETFVKESRPTEPPARTPVNRSAKGDRFVSMAPDRQMVGVAAGSVYALGSVLETGHPSDMPRVAFVRTAVPQGTAAMLAKAEKNGSASPLDLTRLAMARNVAATSVSLASAYAPENMDDVRAPFEALLGGSDLSAEVTLDAKRDGDPYWWATSPLPKSVVTSKEQRCLAEAVYFEARGEPLNGQVAVAQVVLNRVRNPAYPPTICKVVYQNRHMRNRCQFSFACDGIRDRTGETRLWAQAQKVARETVSGQRYLEGVGASTHYHATYVKPRWARHMKRLEKIGQHIFYKTYGGGWS
ncbi:cell wall hydrolase [Stappia sp. ES.058]|uniref:cell wall hydrolase n=1 Tax=Stappia sp. ES.058 TaxID=1881061 RepID=UPI00087D28B0|nr:cell wall hydrolase [Stappia sp. ES.058]SDT92731.1 Cell wall hydrolase CwlJ, involved in spore germination [Stappia sp. ES.058]